MHNLDEYIEYDLKAFLETKNNFKEIKQGGPLRNSIRGNKRKMRRIKAKFSTAQNAEELQTLKQEFYSCIHSIKMARHYIRRKSSIPFAI